MATKEAKKTGPLITKVANSFPNSSTRDALVRFASEVASWDIKFTACGLFRINYELLFAAAGSCATNMAILMQAHIVNLKQEADEKQLSNYILQFSNISLIN